MTHVPTSFSLKESRTGNQRGQTLHEFKRGHHDMRSAVLVDRLELQHAAACGNGAFGNMRSATSGEGLCGSGLRWLCPFARSAYDHQGSIERKSEVPKVNKKRLMVALIATAACATSPSAWPRDVRGITYEAEVTSSFDPDPFSECFRFDRSGSLTIDGLGTLTFDFDRLVYCFILFRTYDSRREILVLQRFSGNRNTQKHLVRPTTRSIYYEALH